MAANTIFDRAWVVVADAAEVDQEDTEAGAAGVEEQDAVANGEVNEAGAEEQDAEQTVAEAEGDQEEEPQQAEAKGAANEEQAGAEEQDAEEPTAEIDESVREDVQIHEGHPVCRSTYTANGTRGLGWKVVKSKDGKTCRIYYVSAKGNVYDTSEPPPEPCFNCGGPHWRKDCPRRTCCPRRRAPLPQPCFNCGGPHWRRDCPRRRK